MSRQVQFQTDWNAEQTESLTLDYENEQIGQSRIIHADCFEWLSRIWERSLHAIVTDPYGVKGQVQASAGHPIHQTGYNVCH